VLKVNQVHVLVPGNKEASPEQLAQQTDKYISVQTMF
jgi:hypothetical protein